MPRAMKTGGRKKSVSGPKKTLKLNGKVYRHDSCSSKKTVAKKKAAAIRKKGGTARVVKTDSGHCVYKGPKSKVKRKSK